MLRLARRRLGVQQVAAQLADVLEQRAVPADDVAPELAGRESLAEHHRRAADERRAGRHHAADAVIHRQAVVHPVAAANAHQPGKPVAPLHQPEVADLGRLGQPGRARCVDVERPILDGRRPALAPGQRLARVTFDVKIDAREIAVARAVEPDRGRAGQVRQRGQEGLDELGGHDDVAGRDHIDAMRERAAGEVGVEERHHTPDAGDAEPDGQVFGPVRHEQSDGVRRADAVLERPARVAARALGERAIGQRFAVREERRRLVELRGELVDHRRQDALRRRRDRRRQLERTQPGPVAPGRPDGRGGLAQRPCLGHAVLPASTVSTVPVMLLLVSPSRNSTACAMSSTSGRR